MSDAKVSPAVRKVRWQAYLKAIKPRLVEWRRRSTPMDPQLPADSDTIARTVRRHGHSSQPGLKVSLFALQSVLSYVPPPSSPLCPDRKVPAQLPMCELSASSLVPPFAKVAELCALTLHLLAENGALKRPEPATVETLQYIQMDEPTLRPGPRLRANPAGDIETDSGPDDDDVPYWMAPDYEGLPPSYAMEDIQDLQTV